MLLRVEKVESWICPTRRLWLLLLLMLASVPYAFAQRSVRSLEELGLAERIRAEQRLWELGYWAGPIDGKFDTASRHALIAFQKIEGRSRTGNLTSLELTRLQNASRPQPHDSGYGHIEIDLTRQVLFVVDESGAVSRILPISSGNEKRYTDHGQVHRAHTPRGTFKVIWKINGWRSSSLGLLYYPSYILNGVAVHGSLSVPSYPASHGCIRVPMHAAKELSKLMPVGTEVVVYDGPVSGIAGR